MWNPEQFDIKANSRGGEWCQLVNPATGEDLYIEVDGKEIKSRVKMLGPKSEAGIKAMAESKRKVRDQEARERRFEKRKETYVPTEDDISANEKSDIEYCIAMSTAWEGIPSADGGEAKFVKAEKERIFSSDGIRSQLITFSVNALNFIKS